VKRSSASHLNCSIARSLDILGEWWTLLIVRDAFFGVRRFDDFVADLRISRNVLTDRLDTLTGHGILERRRYQQLPDRHEYVLTDKGRDLFPVLMALMSWGDRWLSGPQVGGAPVVVEHVGCGHDITGPMRCAHCQEPIAVRDTVATAGPGSGPDAAPPRRTGRGRENTPVQVRTGTG
jgi:DNA-binding HxlR family transcriptional regulator